MHDIHPFKPNVFAGSPLDRADHRRKDQAWIAHRLADPSTQVLPVWRGRNLVFGMEGPAPGLAALPAAALGDGLRARPWAFLGLRDDTPYFALDLSSLDEPLTAPMGAQVGAPAGAPVGASFEDLRRIGADLPAEDASILAHARGLMHWRSRHRFCGVCGAACTAINAGHVMACTGCGTHHFPRTDPAVIMLVTHGDRALLGHPARFRDRRVFTTLAGFVEPGETLEECVAREVFEETGVRVAQARYRSSQPWPFPASIMLGFHATALTTEITVDPTEISEAGWFTREEAARQDGFSLPPPLSIAWRLIQDWIGET
jgi:NAD+ diphosphatase